MDVRPDRCQSVGLRRGDSGTSPVRAVIRRAPGRHRRDGCRLWAGPGSARRAHRSGSRSAGQAQCPGHRRRVVRAGQLVVRRGRRLRGTGVGSIRRGRRSRYRGNRRPDRARGHHPRLDARPHLVDLPGRVPVRCRHRPPARRLPGRAVRAGGAVPGLRCGQCHRRRHRLVRSRRDARHGRSRTGGQAFRFCRFVANCGRSPATPAFCSSA